ncbi:hypothetical protein BZG02_11885 [Labilibaculum filiforme]|uniref:Uncharacterized protein n=1 Tax=Labilibaculum filiforme TaxID=1940526 RepID=A0A2N3HXY1_9BACT|nr:hypothetical protein [Labilibaculum filiforme]PKQ62887.1 hypothetical protein BZG02_11885 [Labilibaculum filiforme]
MKIELDKSTRITLAIITGIATLVTFVILFMGAFFVNDTLEPILQRPESYTIKKKLSVEENYDKQDVLYAQLKKIKKQELNIFQKASLGLLQAFAFLIAILVLPLGIALVFKIAPSKELFYRGIYSKGKFRLDRTSIMQAENPGIYKFHRTDDESFSFSKPKTRRKLIRTFIIWVIITTVVFIGVYNPDTVEILGLPVAALLITILILLRVVLPAPRLIFDRLNGQVIFKGNIVNPGFKASFDKISPAMLYGELMAISHPIFQYSILAFGAFDEDTWSFYVQYMDKNRPLPAGNVFDEYREKDYLRRKAEGYTAPIYSSSKYICDANSGYVNGTPEFQKEIKTFKLKIEDAHATVLQFFEKEGKVLMEPYKLCFLGLYQDQMVFKYMNQPNYDDLEVFKSDKELVGRYLIHKKTNKITLV